MLAKKDYYAFVIVVASFFIVSCASTPKLNTLAYLDNSSYKVFNEPEDDYYIYMRFYNPSYKNKLSAGSILQKGISLVETKPVAMSHVAIGFDLSDEFYGLTAYAHPNLSLEECSNVKSNRYMKTCDPKKSMQTLYAMKVSEEEWKRTKKFVKNCVDKKNVRYEAQQNFDIAGELIFYGKQRETKEYKSRKKKVVPAFDKEKENPFVCSNFTAWVLYNCVDSVKAYLDENYPNLYLIPPSDLASIPGLEMVFSSTWDSYLDGIEKIKNDRQKKHVIASQGDYQLRMF